MQCIRVAMLVVFSLSLSECSTDEKKERSKKEYQDHENRLLRYPCGVPQPKVFELAEVISEDLLLEKANGNTRYIKPQVTVLHRCGSTGCCPNAEQKCVPSATEDVTLTFAVFDRSVQYFEVEEVNHTECVCA